MALISSKDMLIQGFSGIFVGLEKVFDNSSTVQVGGPPVALNSEVSSNSEEQSKGFVQIFEEDEGLKKSEYAQIALQYLPKIIKYAKSLLPHLENGSPALLAILHNVSIIGIGLAGFAELAVLKQIIEKDCSSSGAATKELLVDALEYTKTRIERNQQRFVDIEALIEKAKVEDFDPNLGKKNELLIRLHEKIRVCKIDISECIQKTKEFYEEIESNIAEFSKKLKRSAWAAAGFGALAVAGSITAIVVTGGLAIAAGVAAGATGLATGGFSFMAKLCVDSKHDFIVMRSKCSALQKDAKRQAERLKLHIKELQDHDIAAGISLADFD